jgi:serine/threonine-protein kinase
MTCPSCQAENEAGASACVRCGAPLLAPTGVLLSTVDLSTGTLFHGRYEILGALGRGGMGMVYKARDRTLDEVVAIKVLRPDFAQDPKMAERFKSEIKLARKVHHRNVCAIHDYGEERGLLYISMEYIEGEDLKHMLREQGGLPSEKAYDISIQVAEGLQAVHEAGVIHRDLKTPNIMVDPQGVARLMDFGIAKREGAEGTMTATGFIMGTPEYMSPEQAQGHKVDFRTDVYALAVVVYEIFTGAVPFRGETPISTILKHLHDPPPLDGPPAAALSKTLRPVLRKALAKAPGDRHASAKEFAEALRQARSPSRRQQPMPTAVLEAPTVMRPGAAPAPASRTPLLIGAAAALAVVGVGLGWALRRGGEPPATTASASISLPASLPATTAPPATAPASTPPELVRTPASETPRPTREAVATPRPAPPTSTLAAVTPRPVAPPTAQPVVASTLPAALPTPAPAASSAPALAATSAVPGLLQTVVRPWGEVTVDGTVVGSTPLDKIPLAPGVHTVRVRHPAYEVVERRIQIRPGQTERVEVDFPAEGVKKK